MEDRFLIPALSFIVGIIIKHLWDRFIRRTTLLKYTIWHQYLGGSSEDPLFGSVKVLYNDANVKSLYTSMITLRNESSRDLTNIEINITSDSASPILISYASKKGSLNSLNFTDSYNQLLQSDKLEMAPLKFGRRDYAIPVLNRGQEVDVLLLTTNLEGKQPQLSVGCDYPGVRMRLRKQPPQALWGESQQLCAMVGLVFGLFICYWISISSPISVTSIWLSFTVGAFLSLIGFAAIKCFRLLRKLFA